MKLPRKSAVFISRLEPEVTVTDVIKYLDRLEMDQLVCRKLKTKCDTYSSFYIQSMEQDQHILLETENWPEGRIVSKFVGRKKDHIVSCPPDVDHIIDQRVNGLDFDVSVYIDKLDDIFAIDGINGFYTGFRILYLNIRCVRKNFNELIVLLNATKVILSGLSYCDSY